MASLDILCFNPFNLRNKIMKIEQKIFHGSSKILKNVLWPINICQKYFMAPTKPSAPSLCSHIISKRQPKPSKISEERVSKICIEMNIKWKNN